MVNEDEGGEDEVWWSHLDVVHVPPGGGAASRGSRGERKRVRRALPQRIACGFI